MENFVERAKEVEALIIKDRRFFHENPEVGFDVDNTARYIQQKLIEMGYEANFIGKNGVVAVLNAEHSGPTIMLRADMDALPMCEESNLEFSSKTNAAHMCGHDMHSAMLLGAARIMMKYKNEFNGKVKLLFQPAEEILGGAYNMIESGIMQNPTVDAIFGMHVNSEESVGYLGYNEEYTHASSDTIFINVEGVGSHAAMPHMGIDPINVATHIYNAFQTLNAREIKAGQLAVLTFGEFGGGNAMNIIPEKATMLGTLRAFDSDIRDYIVTRVEEITTNIAAAFRAKATFEIQSSVPSVKNDKEFVHDILNAYDKLELDHKEIKSRSVMGSEDFACYTRFAPSGFISLGAGVEDKSKRVGLHNPKLILNEEALHIGSALHAQVAREWLSKNNKNKED